MQKNGSVNAGWTASRPLPSSYIFHIKIKHILLTYLEFCVKVKFVRSVLTCCLVNNSMPAQTVISRQPIENVMIFYPPVDTWELDGHFE